MTRTKHTLTATGVPGLDPRAPGPNQGKNVVSVKAGCLEGLDWKKAIHIWTKSAMVPIPEGSETHSEESEYTDYADLQERLDQPNDLRGSGGSQGGERDLAGSAVQLHG